MAGNKARARVGFEVAEGIPGNDMTDLRFDSESLDMKYEVKEPDNVDPSGNKAEGETLSGTGAGSISGNPNSEFWLKPRIHMAEYFEQSNPGTGVYRYELRDRDEITEDPLDFHYETLHFGIWRAERDSPTEYAVMGARASKMELAVAAKSFAKISFDLLFLRDRYSSDPVEVAADAAFTGQLHVVGHRDAGDENGDPYRFKITATDGAVGTATLLWGKGPDDDIEWGTTPHVTAERMDIRNPDDTLATSNARIPFQLLIVPGGVFTEDDEFKISATSEQPVQAFSTRPLLNGAAAEVRFTIGGGTPFTERISDYTLTHYRPLEAKEGIGSIYDQTIGLPADAEPWWEFGFNGTYQSLRFKQALLQGRRFDLYVKLIGQPIGSTGLYDFAEFTFTNSMKLASVGGGQISTKGDLPENPVLRSFGPNQCVEVWQNTLASITPP